MNEPTWKLLQRTFLQPTQVVWREWPDGRQESCLVTAEAYLAWVAEGNQPLEASTEVSVPAEENT
jgi:hypothetical protein